MAPSSIDRSGSRTTSSGSTSKRVPSPSQLGQAPYGELKLKLRGASSSNDSPHVGQARCWLKVRVSSSERRLVRPGPPAAPRPPPRPAAAPSPASR